MSQGRRPSGRPRWASAIAFFQIALGGAAVVAAFLCVVYFYAALELLLSALGACEQ